MSDKKTTPKSVTAKKAIAKPFQGQSMFGGASNTFVAKSQYKPAPVRITQHKG